MKIQFFNVFLVILLYLYFRNLSLKKIPWLRAYPSHALLIGFLENIPFPEQNS